MALCQVQILSPRPVFVQFRPGIFVVGLGVTSRQLRPRRAPPPSTAGGLAPEARMAGVGFSAVTHEWRTLMLLCLSRLDVAVDQQCLMFPPRSFGADRPRKVTQETSTELATWPQFCLGQQY